VDESEKCRIGKKETSQMHSLSQVRDLGGKYRCEARKGDGRDAAKNLK
jgi:hypothetical protein